MKTKIILEVGCNHQGNIDLAKKMIDVCVSLGVAGVKFQKRDIESIPPEVAKQPRDPAVDFGATYKEHRAALEFSQDQMFQLKIHAESQGLLFSCTAFDVQSMKDLLEIGVEYVKLPSQLLLKDNIHIAYKNERTSQNKLMVSTGMHSGSEILKSLFYQPDILYHCISVYPARVEDCNISFIDKLIAQSRELKADGNKGFEVGYSSHEIGAGAVAFAVMAGATWIERHFTLDKGMKGHDHKTVSSTPQELQEMIQLVRLAESIQGDGERVLSNDEKLTAERFRR